MRPPRHILTRYPWLPYVAPFALFLALILIQPRAPGAIALVYPVKTLVVGSAIIGTSVVVPVVEEFFWRGFLLRWIINADFRKVAIGTFSWPSFLLTTVLFASEHNRWLVGLVAGVAYNLLLYRTKSLYACIVAHGVTNLALAIYVLTTGEWSFW